MSSSSTGRRYDGSGSPSPVEGRDWRDEEALDALETESLLVDTERAAEDDRGAEISTRASSFKSRDGHALGEVVRWRDLPHKSQLTVLTLARLSEPLVQTSLQSYMFYQLQSFDPSLSDSAIASQAGVLQASFTATQFLTAMFWGHLADSPRFGRKRVLMIGLTGTMLSSLGFGFSQSFWQALFFRSIGGVTNGNIGVLRTMISEIVQEKKYQSRAFLLLPMTYNIGVVIGPMLGGVLCDPAKSYPDRFGDNAFFLKFPYAVPNILSAFFLFSATLAVWMGLEETLDSLRGRPDFGFAMRRWIGSQFRRCRGHRAARSRAVVGEDDEDDKDGEDDETMVGQSSVLLQASPTTAASVSSLAARQKTTRTARYTQRLPFRRLLTRNVVLTLVSQCISGFHMGAYNSLWFIFLSTPVFHPAAAAASLANGSSFSRKLPFFFTGGIGLQPAQVGTAMAILGVFGILMQLFLYPPISSRLGTLRSWRLYLCFFPLAYLATPYLSLVPSQTPPPHAKNGPAIWVAISAVLFVNVIARTMATPAQTILVNNCTPHPSVLGTVHGLAQSTNSLARTLGPVLCGYLYGLGLDHGIVAAVFWVLCLIAIWGAVASHGVYEGNGHEIWLEGDVEE